MPSVEVGGGEFLELNNGNSSFLVFLRLCGFTRGSSGKNRSALVPGYMLGVFYGRIVIKEMEKYHHQTMGISEEKRHLSSVVSLRNSHIRL